MYSENNENHFLKISEKKEKRKAFSLISLDY
jgi:hypothetical protein